MLLLVVSRAWSGELPSAISTRGVIYSAEAAKAEASLTVKELRAELELLRTRVEQFGDTK